MKATLAVLALINNISAVKVQSSPDVYGPNGENYTNLSADQELSQIGIDIHSSKNDKSPTCSAGNWATVHWVGRLMDGRVVTDSKAELGGLPKTFNVGNAEVFKCWDLALQSLHAGDKVTLTCPSQLAYGTAYTWPPVGGEPIPAGSDMYFDLEIEECNVQPKTQEHPQP